MVIKITGTPLLRREVPQMSDKAITYDEYAPGKWSARVNMGSSEEVVDMFGRAARDCTCGRPACAHRKMAERYHGIMTRQAAAGNTSFIVHEDGDDDDDRSSRSSRERSRSSGGRQSDRSFDRPGRQERLDPVKRVLARLSEDDLRDLFDGLDDYRD